jgi:hypothetical protein
MNPSAPSSPLYEMEILAAGGRAMKSIMVRPVTLPAGWAPRDIRRLLEWWTTYLGEEGERRGEGVGEEGRVGEGEETQQN